MFDDLNGNGVLDGSGDHDSVLEWADVSRVISGAHTLQEATRLGDVNGDGFADFGAPYLMGLQGSEGIAVIYGSDQGFGDGLDISELDGSNGFRIVYSIDVCGCTLCVW